MRVVVREESQVYEKEVTVITRHGSRFSQVIEGPFSDEQKGEWRKTHIGIHFFETLDMSPGC